MRYTYREIDINVDAYVMHRNGHPVEVQPRVFDFIVYLIRHRQRAVTKLELQTHVWRGVTVVDSAIARCACVARRVVQDSAAIRTVRGRGYQWTAPITIWSDASVGDD